MLGASRGLLGDERGTGDFANQKPTSIGGFAFAGLGVEGLCAGASRVTGFALWGGTALLARCGGGGTTAAGSTIAGAAAGAGGGGTMELALASSGAAGGLAWSSARGSLVKRRKRTKAPASALQISMNGSHFGFFTERPRVAKRGLELVPEALAEASFSASFISSAL